MIHVHDRDPDATRLHAALPARRHPAEADESQARPPPLFVIAPTRDQAAASVGLERSNRGIT